MDGGVDAVDEGLNGCHGTANAKRDGTVALNLLQKDAPPRPLKNAERWFAPDMM
jgi:hypothetical protein